MRLGTALRALLLASAFALPIAGCGAGDEGDTESADEALAEARGRLPWMADTAQALAERISKHDPTILTLPISSSDDEGLTSARFGAWRIALVTTTQDKVPLHGFLLLPQKEAPTGSFALALADENKGVIATAAYVPDKAKDAKVWAGAIIDAAQTDARALSGAGGAKPQGLVGEAVKGAAKVAIQFIAKLLVRSSEKEGALVASRAATIVEAQVLKLEQSLWREFAATFEKPEVLKGYLKEIVDLRSTFFGKRVVLLESVSTCGGNTVVTACKSAFTKLLTSMRSQLNARSKGIVLAMRADVEHLPAFQWAIENDVPVVVTSSSGSGAKILSELARTANQVDPVMGKVLEDAAKNPAKSGLVRIINPTKDIVNWDKYYLEGDPDLRAFAPLWALADEAIGFETASSTLGSRLAGWLRSFDIVTMVH